MGRKDSLRRRPAREALPRILLVCEGQNTEPGYFRHLKRIERIPIELEIVAGGTPKTLLGRAKKKRDEAAPSRDPNDHYEHVWCVFDIDDHPLRAEARQQVETVGIPLAVSNPCFELWALLRFQEQNAHIHRHAVQSACRKDMPGYEKDVACDTLLPLRQGAIDRVRQLDKRHEANGKPGANPSTGVYRLVELIRPFSGTALGPS
jgi:hypothetical protein